MSVKCFSFRERMKTECCNGSDQINSIGIKIDGGSGSLKQLLGLDCAKSCDYVRFDKGVAYLVEFSNLHGQRKGLFEQYKLSDESLPRTVGEKRIRKSVLKKLDPEVIICEELRAKCLNSILILCKLFAVSDINFFMRIDKGVVFVVGLCIDSTADVIAFDNLKRKLDANLCNGVTASIKILPAFEVDRFFNKKTTR